MMGRLAPKTSLTLTWDNTCANTHMLSSATEPQEILPHFPNKQQSNCQWTLCITYFVDDICGYVRLGQHSSFIMWRPPVTLQTVMSLLWPLTREIVGPDPKSVLMMECDKSLLSSSYEQSNKE